MRSILVASIATFALLACIERCLAQSAHADGADAPQSLTGPGGVDTRVHGKGAEATPKTDEAAKDDNADEKADAAKRKELTRDDPPAPRPQSSSPSNSVKSGEAPNTSEPRSSEPSRQVDGAAAGKAPMSPSETSDTKKAGTPDAATNAKPERGRVGALSPDEQRRAARARERAEAARKPAVVRDRPVRDADKSAPATTAASGTSKQGVVGEPARPPAAEEKAASAAREQADAPQQMDRRQTVTRTEPRRKKARAYSATPPRGPRVGDVIPEGVPLYPLPPGYDRPSRRALAGGAGRGPRVGDVLPPDMPTYPVPSGYGPGY